jgi:hypothetical protein
LWYTLQNRHLLPDISHAEVALFCFCMGGIMYYHEYEPTTMAPFLRGLIGRFTNRNGTSDQTPKLEVEGGDEQLQEASNSSSSSEDGREAAKPMTSVDNLYNM